MAADGNLMAADGGGEDSLIAPEYHCSRSQFMEEKIAKLGTSACPPYHLAIVIGGLSAEMTLKTVKYASARYYDELPTSGSNGGCVPAVGLLRLPRLMMIAIGRPR